MASAAFGHGRNEPEPQPIIVKKITAEHRHVHHGGQWKVAYADFVTAMMAFFMLLWLISTTDEDKRHGIADYFSPTLVEMKENSAGSKGILGGESLSEQKLLHRATTSGAAAIALPSRINGSPKSEAEMKNEDRRRFEQLKKKLEERMDRNAAIRGLKTHVRFTETPEGLRIDLVDEADFSMFKIGTDRLVPQALNLVREVSAEIANMPNEVIVRGHTDASPYSNGQVMNNWMLSTARAEATRMALHQSGLGDNRFERIEGVADTQPFNPADRYDPRNRRMSITLAWTAGDSVPNGMTAPNPAH